jgi:putative acyl-CoA dehydrogenase
VPCAAYAAEGEHPRRDEPGPPLAGHSVLATDPALEEGLRRWSSDAAYEDIAVLGDLAGRAEAQHAGELANTHTPVLRTHSPTGERIDEVEFHPAWHQLMDTAVAHGLTASPWTEPQRTGAHVRRAAGFIVWSQVEAGHLCPVSMTYAAVPALRANPELAAAWVPKLASREYDFGLRPLAGKRGAIAGKGMTEKQGGSDVRANTTRAARTEGGPLGGGDTYRLTGQVEVNGQGNISLSTMQASGEMPMPAPMLLAGWWGDSSTGCT